MALLTVSGGNRAYNIILILLLIGGGVLLWLLLSSEEATRMEQEKITKRIRVVAPEKVKPAEPPKVQKQVAAKPKPAGKPEKAERPAEPVKKSVAVAKEKKVAAKPAAVEKGVKEKPEAKAQKKKKVAQLPHPATDGNWAVHLASFRTLKEAQQLTAQLKKAGYNAYITEFVKDGIKWHRVRVGFYGSKEDAKKVAKALSKRYDKPGAWVVKPSKTEILKHIK